METHTHRHARIHTHNLTFMLISRYNSVSFLIIFLTFVSANDCKDRWKNIRNRYAKYRKTLLLPSGSGAKTVKEYYLAPHLQFLDYYLKSRRSKSNLADYDSSNEETNMSPHRLSSSAESASVPEPSPLSRNTSSKHKSTLNDVHQSALDYFNTKRTKMDCKVHEPIDEDLSFLHSMLSDMKAMNLSQKRKFKIGVMKLAEDILETPVTSPQNKTLPRESVAPIRNPQENENVASFFQLSPYSPVSPYIPNASFNENATLL